MHRVFISYHHARDQAYKNVLVQMNDITPIFVDYSVNSGEIDDEYLTDEQIRACVRDDYLRDSTVTIVLVGLETRLRKHIDWEIFSSMRDSAKNKKSGIIFVNLPETGSTSFSAPHGLEEKQAIYPDNLTWTKWNLSEHSEHFPYLSKRMLDNVASGTSNISVVPWDRIYAKPSNLSTLIELAHRDKGKAIYDLSQSMRRRNG